MNPEHKIYFDRIFKLKSKEDFRDLAFFAFKYQLENNKLYAEYCNLIDFKSSTLCNIEDIPFLPIDFFKTHKVVCGDSDSDLVFESSGTTSKNTSKHFVRHSHIYDTSLLNTFNRFYGNPEKFAILGLLPSYLERKNSSLVYMVNSLINIGKNKNSGFFLANYNDLNDSISFFESNNLDYILIGVSFALLDYAEKHPQSLNKAKVIETGGMKGMKKEITRQELHENLKAAFNLRNIHSEYGMTELLSQAYSLKNGIFHCPLQMKVLIRDTGDPLSTTISGSGALNIIDLANLYSCSFIATDDIGTVNKDGSFDVQGRYDASQIRGCNLINVSSM